MQAPRNKKKNFITAPMHNVVVAEFHSFLEKLLQVRHFMQRQDILESDVRPSMIGEPHKNNFKICRDWIRTIILVKHFYACFTCLVARAQMMAQRLKC